MKIVLTNDGSNTIFLENIDEFYHSPRGAISESNYVFIENGIGFFINKYPKKEISILEVGFGTGLNALLTWIFAEESNIKIIYNSIEKFPIQPDIHKQLNYKGIDSYKFNKLIDIDWNKEIKLSPNFIINKQILDINEYNSESKYDIIFFDAFAKSKQEEMWDDKLILKLLNLINYNGIFVTYAALGSLNKLLKKNNFIIHKRKGALGKREMTLAEKK